MLFLLVVFASIGLKVELDCRMNLTLIHLDPTYTLTKVIGKATWITSMYAVYAHMILPTWLLLQFP